MKKAAPGRERPWKDVVVFSLFGGCHQRGKRVRLKGCSSDQCAVNVRLGHELHDVVRFHGTAVLDAYLGCGVCAEYIGDDFADKGVGFLGFLGGSCQAGADGPYGFIGDDQICHLFCGEILEAALELNFQHGFQNAAEAFILGFSNAEDGRNACRNGLLDFGVDDGIRFPEVLAAFTVSEYDVLEAQFIEHAGGNFTGIGAIIVLRHVLCAHGGAGAAVEGLQHGRDGGEGRYDNNVAFDTGPLDEVFKAFDEFGTCGGTDVHLPVRGNDGFAGHNGIN